MTDKMKMLMEGLPNVGIRAKDITANKYVRLVYYTPPPNGPLYYYDFWACPESLWDIKYDSHRFGNVSVNVVEHGLVGGAYLKPEQVLHIISTCAGISFMTLRNESTTPEMLRWSLGTVCIRQHRLANDQWLSQGDWLSVYAQDVFRQIWMRGAREDE